MAISGLALNVVGLCTQGALCVAQGWATCRARCCSAGHVLWAAVILPLGLVLPLVLIALGRPEMHSEAATAFILHFVLLPEGQYLLVCVCWGAVVGVERRRGRASDGALPVLVTEMQEATAPGAGTVRDREAQRSANAKQYAPPVLAVLEEEMEATFYVSKGGGRDSL